MCEVQKMLDGLCDTFRKYKEQRYQGMIQILEKVRCCECGHKRRLQKARTSQSMLCGTTTTSSSSLTRVRRLLLACFGLMILLCVYLIHVARRYNHVRAYGSNACGSTFFYSYNDCDVFF